MMPLFLVFMLGILSAVIAELCLELVRAQVRDQRHSRLVLLLLLLIVAIVMIAVIHRFDLPLSDSRNKRSESTGTVKNDRPSPQRPAPGPAIKPPIPGSNHQSIPNPVPLSDFPKRVPKISSRQPIDSKHLIPAVNPPPPPLPVPIHSPPENHQQPIIPPQPPRNIPKRGSLNQRPESESRQVPEQTGKEVRQKSPQPSKPGVIKPPPAKFPADPIVALMSKAEQFESQGQADQAAIVYHAITLKYMGSSLASLAQERRDTIFARSRARDARMLEKLILIQRQAGEKVRIWSR